MSDRPSTGSSLSPEELSRLAMARRRRRAGTPSAAGVRRRTATGPVGASFAQQRLWLLDRLQPGSAAYVMPFAYRLRGSLDRAALARAVAELGRRHEALRTVLAEKDGKPVQVIAPPDRSPVRLVVEDLGALPEPVRAERLVERLRAEARRPFDLAVGPLARARLFGSGRVGGDDEHVLLLDVHHAVFDGWSLGILWRELSALYAAFRARRPSPLGDPGLQYADFAVWQRERLRGPLLERHLAYWRERLADPPAVLELPTDRLRPSQPSDQGGYVERLLPAELVEGLRELARQRGASLFMALLTGMELLLSRLAGQEDLLVGMPDAGRVRLDLEAIVGFFVNALPVRARIDGDRSFLALLDQTRREVLGARSHQEVPLEKLLEELQPERSVSRAPLFQVMFNMIDLDTEPPALEGLEVEPIEVGFQPVKFDFTIYAETVERGVELHLLYSTDLFERPRIESMLDAYEHLLRQALDRPEAPVGELSLLTPQARTVLPDPTTPLDTTWRGPVQGALGRWAREAPERTAAVDRHGRVTYGELSARSNRLAHRLLRIGVGKGEVVAILGHRDASLATAVLGVLGSGAAVAVLDPAHPTARLEVALRQAAPGAIVQLGARPSPETAALLSGWRGDRLVVLPERGSAAEEGFLGDEPVVHPKVELGPDDPATVVFTSGSTGVPKGVLGRHGSLSHFLPWWCERFGLGSEDRFSVLSALAHDPLQRDLFTPLWLGAAMVFPDPDRFGEPGYLARWAADEGITVASLTPAMLQLLTQSDGGDAAGGASGLPALRVAFVIGDILTRAHVARLDRIAPGADCFNLYGSTESQRALACGRADLDRPGKEVLSLGRGIPGCQALVVREDGRLAGIGEPGEIWLRSPHLALGYLGDPQLTAERFHTNPFSGAGAAPDDRIYRTGDLGRFLPDGGIEFAGRADRQVKIRGFRIELGEVESVLAAVPGVAECAVVARDDLPGGKGLVAYLVSERPASAPAGELRAQMLDRLPDYMVPALFVSLEALPKTGSGKIDRDALPAPSREELATVSGMGAAPRGETETLLARLWEELLGVDGVGREDEFFRLGGHSLLATRMIARVRELLGCEVTLATFFERPTLAGLARVIEATADGATPLPPVVPRGDAERSGHTPPAWGQQRLWFLERLEPAARLAHHLVQALELSGELDLPALEQAVAGLVRRHEPLRTRILEGDEGLPYLAIDGEPPCDGRHPLPVTDLSGLGADRRRQALLGWMEREASTPFALDAKHPARWRLARLGDGCWVLLIVVHHVAIDGWSYGVLLSELSALYRERVTGEPAGLPGHRVSYADWATWQRRWLSGPQLEAQLGYWTAALSGASTVLELPADRPRPERQSFRGRRIETRIGAATRTELQAFCRREGLTPYMVLVAVFGALLGRTVGRDDLIVGTPIANRRSREVEPLVGLFANLLALRIDLAPGPEHGTGLAALARRVRRSALGAYAHQDLPFERLVDALDVERDLARSPLVQVLFALQNAPGIDLDLPGLEARLMELPGVKAQNDLYVQTVDLGEEMRVVAEYAADLFDEASVRALMRRFVRLLGAGLEAPHRSIHELDWLDAAEKRALLAAGDGGAPVPAAAATLHGLVAARAVLEPDRLAVVCGSESLSYGDLVAAGRRLGRHLRSLGVGLETPVAVLVERTPALVACLLGVLEAGGSYLPLDPSYPPERLAAMARDAGVEVVVTERALAGTLPLSPLREVVIDSVDRRRIEALPETPLPAVADAATRAYLLYTSGSTGRPKGVEVEHGSAVAFLAAMAEEPGVGPDDAVLATTTISFDISLLELFLPLTVGARVVLVDRSTAADPAALAERLAEVTVAQATPTSWRMLLDGGWRGRPGLKALSGGEPLDRALAERLVPLVGSPGGSGELWNVYGPTETTVWSSAGRVEAPVASGETLPIGRAIAGTRLHVVDRGGALGPLGVPGELWIAGAGVARGYRARPATTATVFVPDPFSDRPGARTYRTGDLARRRHDGRLECLGRIDQQVKVRGHRIEPGEIEAALAEIDGIAHAVVAPFVRGTGGGGERRLAAYLVLEPGGEEPGVDLLRSHLEQRLPAYMAPAAFVFLPELPRNPNGKVDRKALPEPSGDLLARAEEHVEPSTEAEKAMARLWAEVLGVERVGLGDRFFHLGGDSILALQVVARAARAGWKLEVRDLFRHSTLGELAAVVRPSACAAPVAPATSEPASADSLGHEQSGLDEEALADLLEEIG